MPEQTLQPGAAAGIDTYIDETNPAVNNGANANIQVGITAAGDNRDIHIKFDLSSISPGSKIEAATLSLYVNGFISLAFERTVARLLPANSAWTEGGATWNTLDGANPWAGGVGAETADVDYSAALMFQDAGPWVNAAFNDFDLAVSEMQAMIDVENVGFKVFHRNRAPALNRSVVISSSDNANAAQHPKLYVRWIEPSGRLVEYTFDVWDPERKILDAQGRVVPPDEIQPDNWISVDGIALPESQRYSTLVRDPSKSRIVETKFDNAGLRILGNKNEFADVIISRAAGGKS